MKKLAMMAVCAAMAGCDFDVPLSKTPEMPVDGRLTGLWERTQDGKAEKLLLLPQSAKEWVMVYPAATDDAMVARVWLCRGAGTTLAQLQYIGTGRGDLPENGKVFQVASFSIDGNTLTVRTLNPSVVGGAATTPAELAKDLERNKGESDLYRDAMVFTRAGK